MKKKLLSILLTVAMGTMVFAGCGSSAATDSADDSTSDVTESAEAETADEGEDTEVESNGKKVTALFFSLEGEYFTIMDTMLQGFMEERGYEYESQSSNMDSVTMIEQIENAVAGGTDAIWVWSDNGKAISDACKAAVEQGVIVYAFVQDPGEDARTVFRGTDQAAVGRSIGVLASEWADDAYGEDAEDGSIKAIIIGDPSGEESNTSFVAVQEQVATDPRFEVLEAVSISTSTVEAQTAAENMFSKYGDIDAFITCGGEMAIGVCSYLTSESCPVDDPTAIGVFGTEITEETAALMKDGLLKGTVSNGGLLSDNLGAVAEQLDALLQGEEPEGVDETNFSQVDIGLITIDNLADYGY